MAGKPASGGVAPKGIDVANHARVVSINCLGDANNVVVVSNNCLVGANGVVVVPNNCLVDAHGLSGGDNYSPVDVIRSLVLDATCRGGDSDQLESAS